MVESLDLKDDEEMKGDDPEESKSQPVNETEIVKHLRDSGLHEVKRDQSGQIELSYFVEVFVFVVRQVGQRTRQITDESKEERRGNLKDGDIDSYEYIVEDMLGQI